MRIRKYLFTLKIILAATIAELKSSKVDKE